MKISEMQKAAHANARTKGFYDKPPTFAEQIALIHSEASEALEALRERGIEPWQRPDGKPEGVMSELADIIIRVGDMAEHVGGDLQAAVEEKMAFNATRPYRHGGKAL